ncbi:hypothetical protein LCGC14_2857490 [marine sediment metagenome]|uniref:Uncharacterized protein n=1 Tax=marine sediment metagenome TaxID=412755 RepID=A0A0F9AF14_9ZZZZ
MKVNMKFKKSTKNKHVFEEVLADGRPADAAIASIPSLYIKKNALPELTQEIIVTVEVVK